MNKTSKSEIETVLQKLDEKFINREIDENIYNELKAKYERQLNEVEKREIEEKLLAESRPLIIPHAEKPEDGGNGTKIGITVVAILIIVGVIFVVIQLLQREAMQNVELSLSDVQIRNVGFTSATLEIYLNMYNPNSGITATLDRMDYSVYANGNYLGNGQVIQRVDISPKATKMVSSTFQVSYAGTLGAIWSALTSGGNIKWNLKGTAYFDTPFGTLNIPINQYK
jgi:LEA14-like dessication related protein